MYKILRRGDHRSSADVQCTPLQMYIYLYYNLMSRPLPISIYPKTAADGKIVCGGFVITSQQVYLQ